MCRHILLLAKDVDIFSLKKCFDPVESKICLADSIHNLAAGHEMPVLAAVFIRISIDDDQCRTIF